MNKIPVDQLYRIVMVVKNAKEMARSYTEFYGIENWNVTNATLDYQYDFSAVAQ